MRLSDFMTSELAFYPIIAMMIFIAAFIAIAFRAYHSRWRAEGERQSLLPLEDGRVAEGGGHE